MKIIVRAFNKDGYHKDILSMDENQVWMKDFKVIDPSCSDGLIGHGGRIFTEDFPEMTHFEIVVKSYDK